MKAIVGYDKRRYALSHANGIREPFDPLAEAAGGRFHLQLAKNNVLRILESYQGPYDFAQESLQNAIDADEERVRLLQMQGERMLSTYRPEIHTIVDLKENELCVIDNGPGMRLEEALRIFIPSYTNKDTVATRIGHGLRGHKGAGFTFLAFNHNYIRVATKGPDGLLCYEFAGGKRWAEAPGYPPLPKALPAYEKCEYFNELALGTVITIRFDDTTSPTSLSRLGNNLIKWEMILRTRTPNAFVDLRGTESWQKRMKSRLTELAGQNWTGA